MKINLSDTSALKKEFEALHIGFNTLHDDMQTYLDGYQYNFYYGARPNMTQTNRTGVNLIQLFADKLWQHTSEFPKINVPSSPDDMEAAELREKIILATHLKNGTDQLWGDWTFDGTVMAACVARTVFNVDTRCVEITRYDPRRCYWRRSDGNSNETEVFWTAIPMTKKAIAVKYGIHTISGDAMTYDMLADYGEAIEDGEDYYYVMTRDDGTTTVEWVGDKFIKKPYKHLQGGLPIDIAMPYRIANFQGLPKFYLSKLKDLQADFNEMWRRRGNIVRKLGNPTVWGRGVYKQNEQSIRENLQSDGGFIPLKENGELGLLTIPETRMIDTSLNECFQRMKDLAGFPTATFGESVGANTSGDALGMYFTPTQKMVNLYNKSYKAFLQGINAKILRGYDMFGKIGEEFSLNGFMPHGSLRTSVDGSSQYNKNQGYGVKFTTEVIQGNYVNIVTPAAVTPKDDIAYKRFILDSVTNKFLSKVTGYDEIGLLSPEDEWKRLVQEQEEPAINPQGFEQLAGASATLGAGAAPQPIGASADVQLP